MTIIILLLVATIIGLIFYCKHLSRVAKHQVEYNEYQASRNKELQDEANCYQQRIDYLKQEIANNETSLENTAKLFDSMKNSLDQAIENQDAIIKKEIDIRYKKYSHDAETVYADLYQDLYDYSDELRKQINREKQELKILEEKQLAFINEQKRKAEMLAQKDYYRLNISTIDEGDIALLREIQSRFFRKEAIDKIIWDVYYKPAYDILMSHLMNKDKVCGIYKITCISSEKSYIGQSVDIKERFKQHIKTALSSAPSTNKLYQEMKQYKPSDFLFEILEEVPRASLNERETYWINFYKTKEYGLNKTSGGS